MALTRRQFVQRASAQGALLVIAIGPAGEIVARRGRRAMAAPFTPNQWLTIDTAGIVTLVAHKSDMGQGVRTSLPMILAAELGVDWSQVRIEHAQPGAAFQNMGTAGSGSVSDSWLPLRRAAATARAMLVSAAAARLGVAAADCTTDAGNVVHRLTSRRIPFGELVEAAARLLPPMRRCVTWPS